MSSLSRVTHVRRKQGEMTNTNRKPVASMETKWLHVHQSSLPSHHRINLELSSLYITIDTYSNCSALHCRNQSTQTLIAVNLLIPLSPPAHAPLLVLPAAQSNTTWVQFRFSSSLAAGACKSCSPEIEFYWSFAFPQPTALVDSLELTMALYYLNGCDLINATRRCILWRELVAQM